MITDRYQVMAGSAWLALPRVRSWSMVRGVRVVLVGAVGWGEVDEKRRGSRAKVQVRQKVKASSQKL